MEEDTKGDNKITKHTFINESTCEFQKDVEKFLRNFKAKKSYKWIHFAEVYNSMDFSNIFAGIRHLQVLHDLTIIMFDIVKKYFNHSTDLYIQTGAIFLLFALYSKQTVKNFIKIRLTRDDYSSLNNCVQLLLSKEEHDLPYKYCEMKAMDAFHFVAEGQVLSPDSNYLKSTGVDLGDDLFEEQEADKLLDECKNLMEHSNFKELAKIESKYSKAVKECRCKNPTFSFYNSTILKDIEKACTDIKMMMNSETVITEK